MLNNIINPISSSSNARNGKISASSGTSSAMVRIENETNVATKDTKKRLPINKQDQESNGTLKIEIYINSLPKSISDFCRLFNLDEKVIIEYILLDAYNKKINMLDEDDTSEENKQKFFKDILKDQYISDNISSDSLEIAKKNGWLQDSDIETIKRLRESYKILVE